MDEIRTYRVIVSDRARRMLGEHIRFLAKVDPNAARRKKQQILAELRSLSKMPQRYPFFEEEYIPRGKYHKMYIDRWYLVLYQIRDAAVYVDLILDCRKEYDWLTGHNG